MNQRSFTTLFALGAMATATIARSDIVVFDNSDGTFFWEQGYVGYSTGTFLDITQPATQSGERLPNTFGSWFSVGEGTPHWNIASIRGDGPARVVAEDEPTVLIDETGTAQDFYFVRELGIGDIVAPDMNFATRPPTFVGNSYTNPDTYVPIDLPAYIGVSFEIDSATHYGWILVEWANNDYDHPVRPLAWAYETDANTPIRIPGPGGLTLLGLAAVLGPRRRR
jgi:hypothetical protein